MLWVTVGYMIMIQLALSAMRDLTYVMCMMSADHANMQHLCRYGT